jgi:hypothetical protein
MKMNQILAIMLGLTCAVSQPYFWENWGRPSTPEELEQRKIDLKYQEKSAHIQHEKQDVAVEARKKQQKLGYKESELELKRKEDRLKKGY